MRIKNHPDYGVEREVIRLVSFAIAGYLILSGLHILWIMLQPQVKAALESTLNMSVGFSMVFFPLVLGIGLLIGKLKRNIHITRAFLGIIFPFQFLLGIFGAIAYKGMLINLASTLGVGTICLILWVYYRQLEGREYKKDNVEVK